MLTVAWLTRFFLGFGLARDTRSSKYEASFVIIVDLKQITGVHSDAIRLGI
jgi:hypothetical protein